jgi:outer membrane protein OmpA-like peptidoglycan-associated protein
MVQFDVGSAVLTMESKGFLDRVATALKNKKDYVDSVTIVGHTDATGSKVKNKVLSKQRAESVRQYLASTHDITNVRTDGVGSEQLKDPSNPKAGVNRRIEFAVEAADRSSK